MPNNREWAMLAWLCIFMLWALSHRSVRSSLRRVLLTAWNAAILVPLGLMLCWIVVELWLGDRISLWSGDLTTDVVIWVGGSAIALFFKINEASQRPYFFRRRVLELLGITELIQFITELFAFSLIVELIFVPIVTILVMLSTFAAKKEPYRAVRNLVNGILAVLGIGLIAFSCQQLIANGARTDWHGVLLKFMLPLWLTVGLVPFAYALSMYVSYERAFKGMNWSARGQRVPWRAKLALVVKLHFRTHEVAAFNWSWARRLASADSFASARHVMADFQNTRRTATQGVSEEKEQLQRHAGSNETDADGRRLDRREFKATTAALRWLATCQMGWYRNQGGKYRPELLKTLGDDFTRHGLPPDSGITMEVAEDGQSWYAWRRTLSGWCFAIGAAGPPPDQWEYDLSQPPNGYPGQDPMWGSAPYSDEVNRNWHNSQG